MKKTMILAAMLLPASFAFSQKPETVVSFITNEHDAEWYAAQAEAWQKEVDADTKDEWAWRNLFRATNYHEMFTTGFTRDASLSPSADIIRRMEKAIPDSYILNLSKGRYCLPDDSAAMRGDNIYRAIELMPTDAHPEDVNYLACRLWSIDPENVLVGELFRRSYRLQGYPARIMHFNQNMLQSMKANALYFANGDVVTAPMKMIQVSLDERQDVTVIPVSFLHSENYISALCKLLGIAPLAIDKDDYGTFGQDWYKHFEADIMMYLIRESKRPAYFSTDILRDTALDKDSLYNEGLLLKYNPKQYDNFAVAMHNVKDVYHLEYLAEPDLVYDSWVTSHQLDMNCVTLLSHLISKFRKKGDDEQADRLHGILSKCVERSKLFDSPDAKAPVLRQLKEEAETKR